MGEIRCLRSSGCGGSRGIDDTKDLNQGPATRDQKLFCHWPKLDREPGLAMLLTGKLKTQNNKSMFNIDVVIAVGYFSQRSCPFFHKGCNPPPFRFFYWVLKVTTKRNFVPPQKGFKNFTRCKFFFSKLEIHWLSKWYDILNVVLWVWMLLIERVQGMQYCYQLRWVDEKMEWI